MGRYATIEERLAIWLSQPFRALRLPVLPALTIKRVGAMTHWRIGRVGGSFYVAKRKPVVKTLPGRVFPAMTPREAAAYRAQWAQTCDAMTANTW